MRFSTAIFALVVLLIGLAIDYGVDAQGITVHFAHTTEVTSNAAHATDVPAKAALSPDVPLNAAQVDDGGRGRGPLCNLDRWGKVWVSNVEVAASYLRDSGLMCGAEARQCQQLACHKGASIALCNDTNQKVEQTCYWMASYATDIITACRTNGPWFDSQMNGQKFSAQGWNVVVSPC